MAIAPSKLGKFVLHEGFSWPTSKSVAAIDSSACDQTLARRLRETDLVRANVTDAEIMETFQAARREHVADGYSKFNSPHERVRVFLQPYLTKKGRHWAVPLQSLNLLNDDSGNEARNWWKFWKR
jgi:hypothetical protein